VAAGPLKAAAIPFLRGAAMMQIFSHLTSEIRILRRRHASKYNHK
jgi:hypothetical protein